MCVCVCVCVHGSSKLGGIANPNPKVGCHLEINLHSLGHGLVSIGLLEPRFKCTLIHVKIKFI
jgi:hypothetical protein